MTLDEIRQAILLNIDDKSGDLFTNDQLDNIITRSFNHIYRKLLAANIIPNNVSLELTIAANTREIIIAPDAGADVVISDLMKPIMCLDSDSWEIPIYDMETSIKSENRSVYIRRTVGSSKNEEHYLGYYRVPSAALTVTLYYVPKISNNFTDLLDTTLMQFIPDEHHDVVINYATMIALGKDEINVKFWSNMYYESLSDMLDVANNTSSKYQGVVDVAEQEEWE